MAIRYLQVKIFRSSPFSPTGWEGNTSQPPKDPRDTNIDAGFPTTVSRKRARHPVNPCSCCKPKVQP
ncbi:hypothetical protein GALMADRAFT_248415 [Galerina marginata CBS 339.88]|uniref:Uncharacterized protein n=1 Tax=Galerina marginata (strain CBS 339.88) TaxID=685588 RepID=A0A067T736_GALM3|nr:hypothetical protein GALMADRAFT_248415 [Galerina marginata CBS 339.88]